MDKQGRQLDRTNAVSPTPHVHVHAMLTRAELAAARNFKARAAWVASLGEGGFLTVTSSPIIMWLGEQLAARA